MSQRDLLRAALRYARRGWAVFPLNGKKPMPGTHGFRAATTDPAQIKAWWRQWPEANIGIACSSRHGPLVLDVDEPNEAKGERHASALIDALGLADTREASSGSAEKRHLYFAPPADGSRVARKIRIRHDGVKYALDVLGDGGYVVAPPSIHPRTGRRYRWTQKVKLAPFPDELLEILAGTRETYQAAPPLPDIIDEGERDNLLTSLAGSMRRRGSSEAAILAALREENATRVVPPLPDKDLRRIAKSISRKDSAVLDEHLTDLGNARRFITQHADEVRAVLAFRRPWLVWDQQRWTVDATGQVDRLAKQTVRRLYAEAARTADEEQRDALLKHAAKSESAPRIRAMLELASTEPELSTTPAMLDENPWLYNVQNGTLDLRKGKLRPHDRDDLVTRLAPITYDPDAGCPRWEQFLQEVFRADDELVSFVQRAVGYTLTGDTREHCLFFCYGQGANGKSTFLEVLRALFGSYAVQADFSSFLSRSGDGPRNDIARMHGARLVSASEVDGEKGWDGRIVKLLTGDDTVVARRLYEEHFEFRPVHKLWLAANHKPIVKEQTVGFWRRIRLVPFTVVFPPERMDKRLAKKLLAESSGILNWALEGCAMWRAGGLPEPRAVRKATESYREENDVLGEFASQVCEWSPEAWTSTTALYRAFCDWWTETRGPRSQPISMGWFGRLLGERTELKASKRQRIRGWKGIALTHPVE